MAKACAERECATLRPGARAQHCTACHETFTGTASGDEHRVGPFPDGRRCLTPDEMRAKGMRQGRTGMWVWSKSDERLAHLLERPEVLPSDATEPRGRQ